MCSKKQNHVPGIGFIEKLTSMSYPSLFLLWIILACTFAAAYFALALYLPQHGPTKLVEDQTILTMLLDALYYSIITATSTGYGDITPQGFSKVLAALQSMSALLIFAIFVTKLVSRRQELALQQVHKFTFEGVFHNIREELYIIRKGFDRIMRVAEKNKTLSEHNWNDISISYKQLQSILQEIPQFYEEDNKLYTIDQRREMLLHESVFRTLGRINEMLDVLSEQNIDWASHETCMVELRSIVEIIDTLMPHWGNESPYTEAFEDILHLNKSIHDKIKKALPST